MFLKDIHSLQNFAADFAQILETPACVALCGDLGAGKTEFARAVIRALRGPDVIVPSPTFTMVQDYGGISHFDLYRVKSTAEFEEIGFFDALAHDIVLIEWPDVAKEFLPKNAISVTLVPQGMGRNVKIKGLPHETILRKQQY